MTAGVLRVAVVGHTNTGKTSLLRTLTRDVAFGEVSDRAAVTRDVSGKALLADGRAVVELLDTPGLEDSIGLLERLDAMRTERRETGREIIERFLGEPAASGSFGQEAKALRQVIASDIALYVIDARDRVLGKHRDELEILGRCAVPVVPVLNFVAGPEARAAEWREHLAHVNMHAVATFDTVVLDEHGERRLFEKMRSLLPDEAPMLTALIESRERERRSLVTASARLIVAMLLDVASYLGSVDGDDPKVIAAAAESFRDAVRRREQACLAALLDLHRFRPEDCVAEDLPVVNGEWGEDLFNPEAMKSFGVRATGAATAGALAGLTIDAMVGGMSLGAATATGAALGALLEAGRTHGRRLVERMTGRRSWHVDDATLRLLAVRQIAVVRALLRRGHAGMTPTLVPTRGLRAAVDAARALRLPRPLRQARAAPSWSRLSTDPGSAAGVSGRADPGRQTAEDDLVPSLVAAIDGPSDEPIRFP